jgi:arylsulfate sulfotransferase
VGHNLTRLSLLSFVVVGISFLSACATYNYAPGIITPSQAVVTSGQSVQFTATFNGMAVSQAIWKVNGVTGGSAATGTVSSSGLYTAPTQLPGAAVSLVVQVGTNGSPSTPASIQFFNPSNFTPGTVAATNNPLVALYSFAAPAGASVQVQFGPNTNYGLQTSGQEVPAGGGTVNIFVAGMLASSTYHMQALIHLADGTQLVDSDHTFATGALASSLLPTLTVPQPGGAALAPGVELLCLDPSTGGNQLTAVVTDVSGNVIWYYDIGPGEWPFPMKLLPNGHMLVVASPVTNAQGVVVPTSANDNEVREIDLAGDVINRITLAQIDSGLADIGVPIRVESLHHDILQLPNGHLILLINYAKTINNQPGVPDGTVVLGDALVDWDPQQGPVWTWSTFDHLPLTHAPYGIADWTHANALVYSPDDGNIILSMRNQNWIVKINYSDGAGDGSVLWTFGNGGDITLPAGEAPIEWNYGQHYPTIVSQSSAGIFSLMFFNNGNGRLVNASNTLCSSPGVVGCYSSVPVFQVDEAAKTAQVQYEDDLAPDYSICCGDALQLPNGDLEYDVAYDILTPGVSFVQEVTEEQTPQLLWQMNISGQLAYRAFRIPSLYPGVVWSQSALAAAARR